MNFIPLSESTPEVSAENISKEKLTKKRKSILSRSLGESKRIKRIRKDSSSLYSKLPKIVRLHHEIIDFIKDSSPLPEEREMRDQVVHRVRDTVEALWPGSALDVFGSYRTDLYLPSCDIDIVVFGKWSHKPLYTLKDELISRGVTKEEDAKVIDKAAVPIIKIVDKATNIKVDIAFNTSSGLTSADQVMDYLNEFPTSRPLILVLKKFLSQRELNEVYTGGVSSYGLMLMVISFLQLHPRGDGFLEQVNLGVLLIEFFELYGCHFNYLKAGIRLKDADGSHGSYFRRQSESHIGKFCLPIYDPASEEDNEVLKGSFNMFQVQLAFKQAYKILTNELYSKDPTDGILSLIIDSDCRENK